MFDFVMFAKRFNQMILVNKYYYHQSETNPNVWIRNDLPVSYTNIYGPLILDGVPFYYDENKYGFWPEDNTTGSFISKFQYELANKDDCIHLPNNVIWCKATTNGRIDRKRKFDERFE